jgi:hypothetical protein
MPTEHTPLLRHCLEATARRLADELRGVFSSETVIRYVEAAYEQVGDRPTVGPIWELFCIRAQRCSGCRVAWADPRR